MILTGKAKIDSHSPLLLVPYYEDGITHDSTVVETGCSEPVVTFTVLLLSFMSTPYEPFGKTGVYR